MAASALLWSCPLQLITFWRWSKRSYRQSTEFRTMKPLHWLLTVIVFVVGFVVVHFMLDAAESSYRILDNLSTILGLIVTFLSLLSFREYSWLMLVTSSIGLVLYVIMTLDDPAQSTYLIYGINSMICIVRQFFSVQKLFTDTADTVQLYFRSRSHSVVHLTLLSAKKWGLQLQEKQEHAVFRKHGALFATLQENPVGAEQKKTGEKIHTIHPDLLII
jgi:hypothetical protein